MKKTKIAISDATIKKMMQKILQVLACKKIRRRHLLNKELSLVFVGSAEMKKINNHYRKKNYVTDVLSFSGDENYLGELVFCLPKIKSQARQHSLRFEQELQYMMLHGVLHLLGYDHETSKKEQSLMFSIQDSAFEQLQGNAR